MSFPVYTSMHLVKGEDLNHHGTLFAARAAAWFVETGFVSAACTTKPENIVCLKVNSMIFTKPIQKGDVVEFSGRIVEAGRTTMVSYIQAKARGEAVIKGYITFCNVDLAGKPLPHGLSIVPETEEEKAWNEEAKSFKKK